MGILFIDCYDSFTYNLVHLLEDTLHVKVAVVHNDSITRDQLLAVLPSVDAVVIGPGPGNPTNPADRGVIPELWDLPDGLKLPILGICFGHQSLALDLGADIRRLPLPQHGQYGYVEHSGDGLFKDIPSGYKVILYHSLHAVVKDPESSPNLVPLAYSQANVLMALKHRELPFYGVQFHPESVLSTYGSQLISNFWSLAQEWNSTHRPHRQPWPAFANSVFVPPEPLVPPTALRAAYDKENGPQISKIEIKLDPIAIADYLDSLGLEFCLLHSAAPPGNWSIIGLLSKNTPHIRTKHSKTYIGPLHPDSPSQTQTFEGPGPEDAWKHVAAFMGPKIRRIDTDLPFVGGLVGYITYEQACLHSWDPEDPNQANSDASFVFIENCILVNGEGDVYTVGKVDLLHDPKHLEAIRSFDWKTQLVVPQVVVNRPKADEYVAKVAECKEYLMSGDSYELCLTAESQATFAKTVAPWALFKHLIQRNPAPYSTFLSFDDKLVGTSPERFMSWDQSGKCQFRPIKGTVKKGPGMTYEKAVEILQTPKERSENLMIVDLIRHDLGYLLSNVQCPLLMSVEEYKTVYQLVSVIEGKLKLTRSEASRAATPDPQDDHVPGEITAELASEYTGFDVLVSSLPPGSMTGAPKKRSVEILRSLENRARGLYSGVCGYWSIADNGDWSVVIRSAFQYGGDDPDKWRMGAGGAIVVLSDNQAEFEEMETKLESALQAFS